MTWAIIAFLYVSGALLSADCISIVRSKYPKVLFVFVTLTWPMYGPIIFVIRALGKVLRK